jgi:hypothetical protein
MADIAVKGVLEADTTLSGTMTTPDGVVLDAGDYVLATAQASALQNGIWVVDLAAWVRPTEGLDYRKGFEVRVLEGSVHELSMWLQINEGVPDTSSTLFRKESEGRLYEGSQGIDINGYQVLIEPTGVLAGTYELATINVDAQGRILSATGSSVSSSFIEGLAFEYVNATQVKLKTGSAYIPGINRIVPVIAEITSTVVAGANAVTYLYMYETNGVGQFETSSTAPDAPYSGHARYKTGDQTRRFIGMLRNDGSGNLIPFNCEVLAGNIYRLTYGLENTNTTMRVLNATSSGTTVQTVDISPTAATAANRFVGPSAMSAFVYWITTGSGTKQMGYTPSGNPPRILPAASNGLDWTDLGNAHELRYKFNVGSVDTLQLFINGFLGRR